MVDRFPSLAQTSIPKVLDYPIRSLGLSWYVGKSVFIMLTDKVLSRDFTSGLVRFLYADGWRARIRGLINLIQATRK